jgi:hypothetical protein
MHEGHTTRYGICVCSLLPSYGISEVRFLSISSVLIPLRSHPVATLHGPGLSCKSGSNRGRSASTSKPNNQNAVMLELVTCRCSATSYRIISDTGSSCKSEPNPKSLSYARFSISLSRRKSDQTPRQSCFALTSMERCFSTILRPSSQKEVWFSADLPAYLIFLPDLLPVFWVL